MKSMKKWLAAIVLLAAAGAFFAVLTLPHTGLPESRAQSIQADGQESRLLETAESDAIAGRLAEVKFRTRLSGSDTTRGARVTVFFDDREAQTILYCMEDGTLWLTVGSHKYIGKDAALYGRLRELAEKSE